MPSDEPSVGKYEIPNGQRGHGSGNYFRYLPVPI